MQIVTVARQPFREAAFMAKSSYLELAHNNADIDNKLLIDEDKDSAITADIRMGESEFRVGGQFKNHDDGIESSTDYIVKFDWYADAKKDRLLSFDVGYGSGEIELSPFVQEDTSTQIFNVRYRDITSINDEQYYVLGSYVNSETKKVNLSAGSLKTDTHEFGLFGRYYFNQRFGLGALMELQEVDNDASSINFLTGSDALLFGVEASYDFKSEVGIGLELYKSSGTKEYSNSGDRDYDRSGIRFTAQFRF